MTGPSTCPLHLGSHNSHEAIDHSSPVAEMREVRTNTTINSCSGSYNDQQSRTARSQLLGSPTLSLPPDTTPGEWTASAQSAKPSTGSVCTFRRLGVSILTRCFVWDVKTSSAVAMEVYSYLHPHLHPTDSDVPSRHRRQTLEISVKTSDSTIQHSRSPLSGPKLTTVSIEAEVDPLSSGSKANLTTKSVPFSPPTGNDLAMHGYTSLTLTRHTAIECSETVAWTPM